MIAGWMVSPDTLRDIKSYAISTSSSVYMPPLSRSRHYLQRGAKRVIAVEKEQQYMRS
jgi:hypothetical protein